MDSHRIRLAPTRKSKTFVIEVRKQQANKEEKQSNVVLSYIENHAYEVKASSKLGSLKTLS